MAPELDEITQFFLVTKWDEVLGPRVELEYPDSNKISNFLPDYNPLAFSTQIFMVASSLFGSQEYQKEVVDLPIVTLKIRVRVIFDYKIVPEEEVRGGRLPYMLIIGYPQDPQYKLILDKLQPEFVDYLNKLISGDSTNKTLENFWHKINDAKFSEFKTIDDFFENIKHFSSGVLFGMITGTILRNNIPVLQVNFEKYLQELVKQSYANQKLGQIYINEYQEYFYCFWVGPFAFLLKPPLKHIGELAVLLKNISESLVDHLWSLTLVDPRTEAMNLLSSIESNPLLVGDLLSLAYMSITRKLSGLEDIGLDKQLKNPEIIFYLNFQASECVQLLKKPDSFIDYLLELKKLYLDTHWNGVFSGISYFIGQNFRKTHYPENSFTIFDVLKEFYAFFYVLSSSVIESNPSTWKVDNCPFLHLDKKPNFFTFIKSFLLAFFPKIIFSFELIENTTYLIHRK